MLSSVLRSATAVQVNIAIMRAFVRLRRASLVSAELMKLIEDLSERVDSHDLVIGELVAAHRLHGRSRRGSEVNCPAPSRVWAARGTKRGPVSARFF
jgi:hypothetical protein